MHKNITLLKKLDDAMASGDLDTFYAGYTDDVVVHIAGTSSLAGTYKGKGEFQALFGKFIERAGQFTFDNHAYLADDEHGVILQRSHLNKDGRRLDSDDVLVCHIRDGKISEFWLSSQDQAALDTFIG